MATSKKTTTIKKTTTTNGNMKTVKRNGITYALITPSHLTALKNRVKNLTKKASVVAEAPAAAEFQVRSGEINTIPGTTGSTFSVFADNKNGVAAIRSLGGSSFRIRVVPAPGVALPALNGWSVRPASYDKIPHYRVDANNVVEAARFVADAVAALNAPAA